MKLANTITIVFSVNLFIASINARAQDQDSAVFAASIHKAVSVYHHFLTPETGLYNGLEYVPFGYQIKNGDPFWLSSKFNTGSVTYDGVLYENVSLLYDLVKQVVIVNQPIYYYNVQLISEKVSSFSLLGHNFIRLEEDSAGKSPIRTGFYDVLYHGRINLLKRIDRKINEELTTSEGIIRTIDERINYFIQQNSQFYTVNSKGELLDILNNRKKELNQFIKKNKLNFRKDKENSLIKTIAYYNEISQ